MKYLFKIYIVLIPYTLFINIFSFASGTLGLGTILFMTVNLFFLISALFYFFKVELNKNVFWGLSSFVLIILLKLIFHIEGERSIKILFGSIGIWLIFLSNFYCSAVFFKNNKEKMKLISYISYSFIFSSIIGIVHYYFFYDIPFIDITYGADESGTIFNIADYDLMRFRESSIFFGANVNAYMTVLGYLFLLSAIEKRGLIFLKSPIFWFGLLVHVWNIYISDSRSGIILILLITFIKLRQIQFEIKISNLIKSLFYLLIIGSFILYISFQPRFTFVTILEDPRFSKFFVGTLILSSNPMNYIFGAPLNNNWMLDGVQVSDNLYISLLLTVGLLGFIILFFTSRKIFTYISSNLNNNKFDSGYNLLSKNVFVLFLFVGLFSIPIGMMPFMAYLGFILGGVKYT